MATVIFTAIGYYFGGPVGGAIGSALGGAIDQEIFGEPIEGPKINDLTVSASTYGVPIPLVYGPENRLAGNIIWSSGLQETKREEEEGGLFGIGGQEIITYTYTVSLAVAICEGEIAGLKRIFANGQVIYEADSGVSLPTIDPIEGQIVTKTVPGGSGGGSGGGALAAAVAEAEAELRGTHALFEELHFYPGNSTQQPDPLMESFEGAGNVPGYRHTAYIVIKNLQLANFGNRIPNIEVEIEADTEITVGTIIKDISSRAGAELVSVSALNDTCRGYIVSRNSAALGAILPLSTIFNFDVAEQSGDVRFIKRGRGMKATVSSDDLGASPPSQRRDEPIRFTHNTDVKLPNEVSISYRDPALDYQINTQRAFRNQGTSDTKASQDIPITISTDEARQTADRLLWGSWASRKTANFSLDDMYVRLSPGDILGVPVAGQIVPYKITRKIRGRNGVNQLETRYEDLEVYNSQATGQVGTLPANALREPGPTLMITLDMSLMHDTHDGAGFYWAVTATNQGWSGAEIQRSEDEGGTYGRVSNILTTSIIGNVTTTLADGPVDFWDRANTLTVTLLGPSDTLESASELSVLNGANAAWIGPADGLGGEIIQFADATLVGTKTYQLSTLLRGRRGTDYATGTHGSGEIFVLINTQFMGRSDYGVNDWGQIRWYRPVSFYTDETTADSFEFTNTGVLSKPFSPVHVEGARDDSNNLTIAWLRRSRYISPGFGGGDAPLGEESEAYEIDVYNGAAIVRTIETTSETASYTAAEQTIDGLTPGDYVTIDVYQISATRGRGFARRAII